MGHLLRWRVERTASDEHDVAADEHAGHILGPPIGADPNFARASDEASLTEQDLAANRGETVTREVSANAARAAAGGHVLETPSLFQWRPSRVADAVLES